ncbi:MAG: hypothetical protein A2172_03090 [Candidatus Woykebacteria bacterium RBG_13_40_15]|uniref:N-acetyltransferase domain-containing protein n=1 Tax=Candidatus Woykebacteria bacterium RBG_13_40_15 TaxID=1802593 RepID=A0A1G1W5F5_9BACT|nr:MAG: hypothetical protein A2172_03090 [Candidatus Woykebacteria bacterium RBG_13_40_15]
MTIGTPRTDVVVSTKDDFSEEEIEHLWEMYDEAFKAKRTENPCRQYYRHNDFCDAMKHPDFVRLIGTDRGEVRFFCLLTRQFELIPWIEPAYYECHYPQFVGHMIYIPVIFVPINLKGAGYFRPLVEAIQRHMWEYNIWAVLYDHGGAGAISLLTEMILRTPNIKSLGTIGTQVYKGVVTFPPGKWPEGLRLKAM